MTLLNLLQLRLGLYIVRTAMARTNRSPGGGSHDPCRPSWASKRLADVPRKAQAPSGAFAFVSLLGWR